jgi:hypothetical protein
MKMLKNTAQLKSKLERLRLTDDSRAQLKSEGMDEAAGVIKVVAQEYIIIPRVSVRPKTTRAHESHGCFIPK